MRVTYDDSVDAAYIYLKNEIGGGEVAQTHTCNVRSGKGLINLDFDRQGVLLGIEILNAKLVLPPEVLDLA